MTREEREKQLMELCERVANARARYQKYRAMEDTILSVPTPISREFSDAKHLLVERIRELCVSEDNLWRQLIIGAAAEIEDEIIVNIPGPA